MSTGDVYCPALVAFGLWNRVGSGGSSWRHVFHRLSTGDIYSTGPASESVGQLEAETAPVPLNRVLQMETGGWVVVLVIQQVVNTGGEFEVLDEVLAEEREIEHPEAGGIRANFGAAAGGCQEGVPAGRVLKFQAGEDFVFQQRHAEVEFDELFR